MPVRSFLVCAAVLVGTLAPGSASAQLSTDRPGLALSPRTVGRGAVQVEAGVPEATRISIPNFPGFESSVTSYRFPVALRYGLTRRIELRASTPSLYSITRLSGNDPGNRGTYSSGIQAVVLGAKVAVPVGRVALALVPEVVLSVRGYNASSGLQINAPASFALGDFGVTLMPGIAFVDDVQLNAVGKVSRAFGTLTAYAEAGAFPSADFEGSNPTVVLAGGGVLARLSESTQLDAFFDAGLNDAAPDVTLGVGVSFRFD